MDIIRYRKTFFILSGILAFVSIVSLSLWQLNFGIDFTGGALLEIEIRGAELSRSEIQSRLSNLKLANFLIQPTDNNGFILRFQEIDEETHQTILNNLRQTTNNQSASELTIESRDPAGKTLEVEAVEARPANVAEMAGAEIIEKRFESIGPAIGKELKRKAFWAIILVLIAIMAYIAWVFRKVSKPVASWKYGFVASVALFHDVLIVIGIFSALGRFYGVEVNLPFVAAILTILGYSVNDTIVVLDRIRENLIKGYGREDFDVIVNQSVNQTIARSINTSLTTLFVLLAIFLFGGETLRAFTAALIFGITFGTYSSIFIASPLLVEWEKYARG